MTSTSPRTLFIISNIAIGGGAERVASFLASRLGQYGTETELLTFYASDDTYAYSGPITTLGEPMRRSIFGKLLRAPGRVWRIHRHCKKQRITTAVAFLEEANFYLLLSRIFLRTPVRTVVSVRNNPRTKNAIYRWFMRRLYPRADRVVAVSHGIQRMLEADCGLVNSETIYNPIDPADVQNRAAGQIDPADQPFVTTDGPVFVTVGRLVRQKGHAHLIRAFAGLVRSVPNARLLIIGEGPLRDRLSALIAAAGLGDHVRLCGQRQEVAPYLAAADWFVFSSLWEGMPNTVLEALAAGTPVISADCRTGPREILAPDTDIDGDMPYPYESAYGVLISPLSGQLVYESPEDVPLDPTEQQLRDVLRRAANGGYAPRPHPLDAFNTNDILRQWQHVITSVS